MPFLGHLTSLTQSTLQFQYEISFLLVSCYYFHLTDMETKV